MKIATIHQSIIWCWCVHYTTSIPIYRGCSHIPKFTDENMICEQLQLVLVRWYGIECKSTLLHLDVETERTTSQWFDKVSFLKLVQHCTHFLHCTVYTVCTVHCTMCALNTPLLVIQAQAWHCQWSNLQCSVSWCKNWMGNSQFWKTMGRTPMASQPMPTPGSLPLPFNAMRQKNSFLFVHNFGLDSGLVNQVI